MAGREGKPPENGLDDAARIKLSSANDRTREILSTCVMEEGMTGAVEFLSVECDMIFEPDCEFDPDEELESVDGYHFTSQLSGLGDSSSGLGNRLSGLGNSFSGLGDSSRNLGNSLSSPGDGLSRSYNLDGGDSSRPHNTSFRSPSLGAGLVRDDTEPSPPTVYRFPLIGDLFRRRSVMVYKRSSRDTPFVKIYHPNNVRPNNIKNGKLSSGSRRHTGDSHDDHGGSKQSKRSTKDPLRGRNPLVFRCGKCRKQFTSKTQLLTHRLLHSKRMGDTYPCPICEEGFPNKVSLRLHIRRNVCLRNVQSNFRDRKPRHKIGSVGVQTARHTSKLSTVNAQTDEQTSKSSTALGSHTVRETQIIGSQSYQVSPVSRVARDSESTARISQADKRSAKSLSKHGSGTSNLAHNFSPGSQASEGHHLRKTKTQGTDTKKKSKAGDNRSTSSSKTKAKSHTRPIVSKVPQVSDDFGPTTANQRATHGSKSFAKSIIEAKSKKPAPAIKTFEASQTPSASPTRCKNCDGIMATASNEGDASATASNEGGASATTSKPQETCQKCITASKHKQRKRNHRRERKSYECPECGSQYRKSSALKKHRRVEHDVT